MTDGNEGARKLNDGLLWKHPLESGYAHARRLLSANPGVVRVNLRPFLGRWTEPVRQCPKCAIRAFHIELYQAPALARCPIHHCPFALDCPECRLAWDRSLKSGGAKCSTCGALSKERRGKTQLKSRDYRKLSWLARWVERCEKEKRRYRQLTVRDIHDKLNPGRAFEHSVFSPPDAYSPFYLAFEAERVGGKERKRLKDLEAITHPHALKCRTSKLYRWSDQGNSSRPRPVPLESHTHLAKREKTKNEFTSLLTISLRRFLKSQQTVLLQGHQLRWLDLECFRPEDFRKPDAPCPICIAFTLWCRLINRKFTRQKPNQQLPALLGLGHYFSHPKIPFGVYVQSPAGDLRPSPSFERWMFIRASDYAFSEFLNYALWLCKRAADPSVCYSMTGYHGSQNRFQRRLHPSQIMEVREENGQIAIRYWPGSPLHDVRLNLDSWERVQHCANSRSSTMFDGPTCSADPEALTNRDIYRIFKNNEPGERHSDFFPWWESEPRKPDHHEIWVTVEVLKTRDAANVLAC